MTRFTIDAATALRIIREDVEVPERHSLVGPAALRSQVLSLLYAEVRQGSVDEKTARGLLEKLAGVKIRLLGDRVSRAVAWKLALQLGLDDTAAAEYLAVASLQADALITAEPALSAAAEGVVPVAAFEDLLS
jgi:predicted nucleic acid-binding protein